MRRKADMSLLGIPRIIPEVLYDLIQRDFRIHFTPDIFEIIVGPLIYFVQNIILRLKVMVNGIYRHACFIADIFNGYFTETFLSHQIKGCIVYFIAGFLSLNLAAGHFFSYQFLHLYRDALRGAERLKLHRENYEEGKLSYEKLYEILNKNYYKNEKGEILKKINLMKGEWKKNPIISIGVLKNYELTTNKNVSIERKAK